MVHPVLGHRGLTSQDVFRLKSPILLSFAGRGGGHQPLLAEALEAPWCWPGEHDTRRAVRSKAPSSRAPHFKTAVKTLFPCPAFEEIWRSSDFCKSLRLWVHSPLTIRSLVATRA